MKITLLSRFTYRLTILLIIFIFVFGCTPDETPLTTITSTSTPTSTIPQYNETPDPTIVPSILPTVTATSTITPTPKTSIEENCVMIENGRIPMLDGLIAFSSRNENVGSYFMNLSNGESNLFSNASFSEYISPDGKMLAYKDISLKSIKVIDSLNHLILNYPDPSELFTVTGWLDAGHILLDKRQRNYEEPYVPSALVVVDINTGTQEEYNLSLPSLNDIANEIKWESDSRIILHRSENYLIYPALGDPVYSIVLWNIHQEQELARIYRGDRRHSPQWSPDGSYFIISGPPFLTKNESVVVSNVSDGIAFVGGSELLAIDLHGMIWRLTYFSMDEPALINNYYFSPDGQKIAFGYLTGDSTPETPGELAIYDIASTGTIRYCLSGISRWSLDSKYVVLNHLTEKNENEVYLIKLDTAQAWLIAENAEAIGWMAAP